MRRKPIKQRLIPLLQSIPAVVGGKKGFQDDHEILAAGWSLEDIQYLYDQNCIRWINHYNFDTWEVESRHCYLTRKGTILAGMHTIVKRTNPDRCDDAGQRAWEESR